MKIYKNIKMLSLAFLMVGCANQLTAQATADAGQDTLNPSPTLAATLPPSPEFASQQEEAMYDVLVGEVARQRGEYSLSAQSYLNLAEKTKDPEFAARATQTALFSRAYELAVQAANLWLKLAPNSPDAYQALGTILLQQERTDEALHYLESMLDNAQGNQQHRLEMILAMLEQRKGKDSARALIEKLVERRPDNPQILLSYTNLLIASNELDKAITVLQKILNADPTHEQAIPLYAHVLQKQNRETEALAWMEKAATAYPNRTDFGYIYARMLASGEQYEKAFEAFKRIQATFPRPEDVLFPLGILALQLNKLDEARQFFTDLQKQAEQADIAYYYLGQVEEKAKNWDTALTWYKKIKSGDNFLTAQMRIALVLSEQGNLNAAVEYLRNVPTEQEEDSLQLLRFEAELYAEKERYQDAMATYNRVVALAPTNTDSLYQRGMLAIKMNDLVQMEKDFRQIIELDPENAHAYNSLGFTLADHTNRYEEAYELIKKALNLSPNSHYILDSHGWVLYRLGRYPEAIAELRKAQQQKDDPEIAAHLGEVLWVSGDKEGAKQVWEKATQTFPEDKFLKEVINRFLP
ncbi:ChAPs (Chs5p-Arf1p-binding proteins) [Beggiatoa alba B18LD]|uniref:ChAPs (Chs5p-Arf1p-binding proteins) n=1 Tax=Beggiatoa alba B18LD TaxID=395493 RepID=I3CG52_9GAMM|nr:tetratricopeptide repeat protein [Beggiatoa alba]EIJ42595.1 ChAPs (Chs5p-Arf1p-binding proteins) [Beggiatoa alba B18LD]